ncbi:MAG: glycosyltransferase, partial [Hyphomicrobium sp.]
ATAIRDSLAERGFADVRLDIIGREGWGNETDMLRRHPRVRLRGYLTAADAKAAIESADLYLCTSHDEGLGLPLIEVQFGGLQVVAPDAPVFREVLGASGLFIDPAAPEAAAAAIADILAAPGWRARASAAALANVARWNAIAAQDAACVAGLITGRRDATASDSASAPATP